jgi:hypothetical protein
MVEFLERQKISVAAIDHRRQQKVNKHLWREGQAWDEAEYAAV